MSNLILMCHGNLRPDSSFEVPRGGTLQHRGTFGTTLPENVSIKLVQALLSDPYIDDKTLAKGLTGYRAEPPIDGPVGAAPDLDLSGDDHMPACVIDLTTRRWVRLGGRFRTRLSVVLAQLAGDPFWLNLVTCTRLRTQDLQPPGVQCPLDGNDWGSVLRSLRSASVAAHDG